jgi:hypothetical protein
MSKFISSMTAPLTTQSGALVVPPEVQHFLERLLEDAGIAPENPELRLTICSTSSIKQNLMNLKK